LGHIPNVGDTIETDNATFTIQQMRGRRVSKIKVIPKPEREDGKEA
jgi:CBS domain containing-hemolysin-like protein